MDDTKNSVRNYIIDEFLPGEDPAALTDSTPLITGGILDSLATLKLVAFLEEQYHIEIQAHEATADYLDTVADIANLIDGKK